MNRRSSILQQLRASATWLTGDTLSGDLHISRAAVSKHIRILRDAGYRIDTAPNRGYRFRSAPDLLLADEVQPLARSKTVGQSGYEHFLTIGSTNTEARRLAEKGAPSGTLVVAEEQTSGKGRKSRDWASPKQMGIYATLILRPTLPIEETPLLTLMVAVATCEAITAATGISATIKWPNDILVNGKKVAGILTEVSSEVDRVEFALIGIGLNVNTPVDSLPKRVIFPATSLAKEAGAPQARAIILAHWLEQVETEYAQLAEGDRKGLLDHWKSLTSIIGRRATIQRVNDNACGTIEDIDSDGALLLITADGERLRVLSGDVSFES
ncbi:MAG: biotin--[acetyl-CoA-carboxylase] ligase [Verrucomicrobia bacterium]|jgi:BirA family transcriptional regulator, biotin operon repressor / biotin---[acetyl-CoA-carboxylase] ligase|nr:biotin--[acetyl-CoA-carboxylase] ligase [Verrucomicrobiota bacterium]